jgi:FkbM family methyltransferase
MNYVLKKVDKHEMYLDLTDGGISSVLYNTGYREKVFMTILRSEVKEGMTVIDLGANIGYTTLLMCNSITDKGKVYAIEPDPHNIDLLTRNVNHNNYGDRCKIVQAAIDKKDGNLEFWLAHAPNLNSVQKTKNSIRKIDVPAMSLPSFIEKEMDGAYPNFIKMDIEGHEVSVFEGALDYFTDNPGSTKILMEVHPQFYNEENDFENILSEYMKIGFNSKFVVSTPVPQPALFREKGYKPKLSVPTDGFVRGYYNDVRNEDLLELACRQHNEGSSKKIVRSFMIER